MITSAECSSLWYANYLNVSYDLAGYSLLIYDYFLTMNQEVTLIWPTTWNIGKALFLINRYLPFIGGILLIYVNIAALDLSFETYSTLHEVAGALIYIGLLFAEAIVLFRTWALFGCNPRVGLALLAFAIALICVAVFFLISAVRPSNGATIYCDPSRSLDFNNDKRVYVDYIILMVHETVLLGLTLYKCFELLRRKRSTFISSLFRDGVLYYTYILAATVINICLIGIDDLTGRFVLFQHVLHSIFATRIFLNLRVAAKRHSEGAAAAASDNENAGDTSVSNTSGFLSTIVVGVGTWIHEDDTYFTLKLPQ